MEIIPGILEKEWSAIEKKLEMVKPFAKSVHIDLLDGKFAPNTTFLDPTPFAKYANDFIFELHMMADNPIEYLKPFADCGFKRFIGQVEKMPDQLAFVAKGQVVGEVGLALDGNTAIDALMVPLDELDFLFVMTVNAGYSGQQFKEEYLEKVKALRAKNLLNARGEPLPIQVDGGINTQTILQAQEAGATRFVATSALFSSDNPHQAYKALYQCLQK